MKVSRGTALLHSGTKASFFCDIILSKLLDGTGVPPPKFLFLSRKWKTEGKRLKYGWVQLRNGNKKESISDSNSDMVTLVQSNWNILVEDFCRVKGIITVLYPTNYIPGISRTNEYEPKH